MARKRTRIKNLGKILEKMARNGLRTYGHEYPWMRSRGKDGGQWER